MKTTYPKQDEIKTTWFLVDAKDRVLGRIATKIASLLKGKHKVTWSPHIDVGDGVIVVNCEKIKVTGKKLEQKIYKHYSGYPSGQREEKLESLLKRRPHEVLKHAVKGMLPKTKLGRKMIKRLKLYVGEKHEQTAQKPKALTL